MQFDTLEIQKIIEEKRLVLGQKIERLLIKKLVKISDFFARIFAAKKTALFGAIFIIASSILIQSSRDLGHDSATYPEIAQKMLLGGQYFSDFLESNLPLNFVLTMVPVLIAQKFDFNIFATGQVFWNLLGILSLTWSAKILMRSTLTRDRTIFNLLFLSFVAGFFWRVFTLQFNEFGTKTTYLLAALFPYISYQLLDQKDLQKIDQIFIGSLAALLFCLKPHYGIFAIVFELQKLIKSRNFLTIFCLRNYTTLALLFLYFLFLTKFFPDYLESLSALSEAYYQNASSMIAYMILRDIFPVVLVIFLCFEIFQKELLLQRLLLPIFAASLLILSEFIGGFDQRFIFYSVTLPAIILSLFFLVRKNRINWRRDCLPILGILVLPQFDPERVFFVIFNLSCLWWIFAWSLRNKISTQNKIFFIILAPITTLLAQSSKFFIFGLIASAITFVYVLFLNQKFSDQKKLPHLSAYALFLVLSYFVSLHLSGIFNLKFYYDSYKFNSPNHFTSEIIKTIKHYSQKDESAVIISSEIPGIYPQLTYAGKKNELPFLQYAALFEQIRSAKNRGVNPIISRLSDQLSSKKNKLVFVEIWHNADGEKCSIEFLEYYFRSPDFRKIFLENYTFLTRITGPRKVSSDLNIIDRDVEVYIKK